MRVVHQIDLPAGATESRAASELQHTATHRTTLQHPATPCNTLQMRVGLGYWVATTSKPLKITGFFCKRALQKRRYSAKETYNLNIWMHPYVARGEGSEGTEAV